MHWRPSQPRPLSEGLAYELKRVMARRYWGHDGSLNGEEIEFDEETIPYLYGLIDAGIDGAEELRAAIVKHKRVVVWIE
jgi:hypothetical protein